MLEAIAAVPRAVLWLVAAALVATGSLASAPGHPAGFFAGAIEGLLIGSSLTLVGHWFIQEEMGDLLSFFQSVSRRAAAAALAGFFFATALVSLALVLAAVVGSGVYHVAASACCAALLVGSRSLICWYLYLTSAAKGS